MKKSVGKKKLMSSIVITALVLSLGLGILSSGVSANSVSADDRSQLLQFSKLGPQPLPPGKPIVTGPTEGYVGVEYEFCAQSSFGCPSVDYQFDWNADGGHDYSPWYGPYYSGEWCCKDHSWDEAGTYNVRAWSRAPCGHTSPWSDPHYIVISELGDWHVNPGESIQDAVDDAAAGDTIYVHDDDGSPYTYHENVDVNKPDLTLIGDGMDTVTVDAVDSEDHTFHITEDGITMMGFTITGSYSCGYGGICIDGADDCGIYDCNCRENLCAGIFLKNSGNCEIINNIVSDNDCGGIKLADGSDNNVVKSNIMENNINMGMNVYGGSSGNLIYNNYFDNPSRNAIDSVPWANTWNTSKTSGANIIGGPYLGGNYFSDYTGEDNDGDGLGDTPYEIKNWTGITNMDYLPLVISNNPPDAPTIIGETNGAAGTSYDYGFTSIDPDGDDIAEYIVDWGDETGETITGPFASGAEATASHTWDEQGDYIIRAKAKDIHGAESDWGYLEVTMPVNQQSGNSQLLFPQILERPFERFPLLEGIFYHHSTPYQSNKY